MTAQQMPLPPRPTVSRLVTAVLAVVISGVIVVLSLWLLIAAGLQSAPNGDISVPSILPEGPPVVEEIMEAAEPIPLPGLAR
jgi:uncharacterized membrane protein